jgi:hypothetical protein
MHDKFYAVITRTGTCSLYPHCIWEGTYYLCDYRPLAPYCEWRLTKGGAGPNYHVLFLRYFPSIQRMISGIEYAKLFATQTPDVSVYCNKTTGALVGSYSLPGVSAPPLYDCGLCTAHVTLIEIIP